MTQVRTETLRVVGGRRQEGAPPGVAVLTAPLHPARGREDEIFLMVADLGEGAPSRLHRDLRETTAQTFWSTPGSVTAALRQAIVSANRFLYRHNLQSEPEQRGYGALSCAALKANELFLAQAGPACACVLSGAGLERFPRENLSPLGEGAYVEVRLAYLPVRTGDILVLATEGLAGSASEDALRRVLSLRGIGAVLDGLEQVAAGEDFAVLMAHWREQEPVGSPAPPSRRRRAPAPPPKEPPPPARVSREEVVRPDLRPVSPEPVAEEPPAQVWEPVEVLEEEVEVPPWEPPPEAAPPPRRRERPPLGQRLRLGDRLRGVGRVSAGAATAVGRGLRTLFRRALPGREVPAAERPRRERRPPPAENPRLMAGVTLAILAVVALVTVLAWSAYGSAARRDRRLSQAREYVAQAGQAVDPAEERRHWEAVMTTLAGMEADPEAADLLPQAREALDRLDKVVWVEPVLLRDLGADAPVRRLVVHGQEVFLMDAGRQAVSRLTLREAGEQVVEEAPATLIRAGEEREGQRVGPLVDLAWNLPSGDWTTNALVVLDAENRLWIYEPAWADRVYPLFVGPAPGAGAPTAMAAFDGRLYVLDPQVGQVWRYWPRGGGYPDSAGPYFPSAVSDLMGSARDLAINGSVYVLFGDGSIAKYYEGASEPFEITSVPAPPPSFVALTLDPSLADGSIYVADAGGERLVILDGEGTFRAQLRAASDVFSDLQALALDDAGGRIFFVAGGRLYVVPMPPLP